MNRQPDMRQLMKQAQKMQEELMAAQNQLAEQTFEGSAGGGVVKATVKGSNEVVPRIRSCWAISSSPRSTPP